MQKPVVNVMVKAARLGGNVLLRQMAKLDRLQVVEKARMDYASEADSKAEEAIVAELRRAHPDYAVLGEEGTSTPGKGAGSRFWFAVRLAKTIEAAAPAYTEPGQHIDAALKERFAGRRILLAEDEPMNQLVSRLNLEQVGLVVDVAADGRIAIDMATHSHYDLILMDLQMPNMNGIDATKAIRLLPGYTTTPIVAVTANAFEEDRKSCLEAGMNDHLSKPVHARTLYETALKWLSAAA